MSVTLSHIAHRFGATEILKDVCLSVPTGEIACLLGPSGCGKTTLLRLVAGLEPLQTGTISIGDDPDPATAHLHDVARAGPGKASGAGATDNRKDSRHGGVAIVFQDFLLFPHMTALENVAFGLDGSKHARHLRAQAELDAVDLGHAAQAYPNQLSGGQQQRVALARAFARDPRLILLDEPFASIDAATRQRLRQSLRALLKARGATALVVTHDPDEALDLGDTIAIMGKGAIIESGPPRQLYDRPETLEAALIFPGAQAVSAARLQAFGAVAPGLRAAESAPDDVIVLLDGAVVVAADDRDDAAGQSAVVTDCRFAGPGHVVYCRPMARSIDADRAGDQGDHRHTGGDVDATPLRARSPVALPAGTPLVVTIDKVKIRQFTRDGRAIRPSEPGA